MTTKIPTIEAGMKRTYMEVAPTSAMPELPGVSGIIIRIARIELDDKRFEDKRWLAKPHENE